MRIWVAICLSTCALCSCAMSTTGILFEGDRYFIEDDDLIYFESISIPNENGSFDLVSSSGSTPVLMVSGQTVTENMRVEQLYEIAESYCADNGATLVKGPSAATGQLEGYGAELNQWVLNAGCRPANQT